LLHTLLPQAVNKDKGDHYTNRNVDTCRHRRLVRALNRSNARSSQTILKVKAKGAAIAQIVFNYRYLLDGLLHIDQKEVLVRLNNEATPVVFYGQGNESYLYLVAPLKSS